MATKLYVANLPPGCTDKELHDLFAICGPVAELDIIKNYAFIHMGTNEAAQEAVAKYNNTSLNGRIISVHFSKNQNVNRANKFIVKYDRPDQIGRDGQGSQMQRGGFQGRGMPQIIGGHGVDLGGDRFGHDYRNRGVLRGGRAGPESFHRGKPYDRNPAFNQNQPQSASNSSNLQPIRPVSADVGHVQNHTAAKIGQNLVPTLSLQSQNIPIQVHARPTVGSLQPIPVQVANPAVHPQISNVSQHHLLREQQQLMAQNVSYQQMQSFNELQPQLHAVTPQQMVGSGAIPQQSLALSASQPMSNVQPVHNAGMVPLTHRQSGNPLHGYTVYERYVDYRHPRTGDMQQVVAHNQIQQGGTTPVAAATVYQAGNPTVNKDPYANAQLMYER